MTATLTAIGTGVVAVALFVGGVDKAGVPNPITVDGETIEFTWTDDNTNEDLIIYTDQERYSQGLSNATVYVAVANMSGIEQDIELAGYFVNERRYIKDIKVLSEVEEVVPAVYETVCAEVKDKVKAETASSSENIECSQVETAKETTQTIARWIELPAQQNDLFEVAKDVEKLAKGDKVRKSVDGYIANKKSTDFAIKDKEVLYYKLEIAYPVGDDGNFFLEAIGSEGAYGHLDPWFDTDWTKRVAITIDATKVPSTQTSFPVYVDLGELPAGFHTNVKSDGCDIRVVESDETTETAFELVSYDAGTDSGELHFLADSISGSTDTTFYIYYGNAGASCYAVTATYGRNNVWTGYYRVSHDGGATDSTGNDVGGTEDGGLSSGNSTSPIGKATTYTSSTGVGIAYPASSQSGASERSHSSWVNMTSSRGYLIQYGGVGSSDLWRLDLTSGVSGKIEAALYANDHDSNTGILPASTWVLLHIVYDGSTIRFYSDGDAEGTGNAGTISTTNGSYARGIGISGYAGKLAENRMYNGTLSGNTIATEYNNQSSVSTFITPGAEEDNGGGSARRRIMLQ